LHGVLAGLGMAPGVGETGADAEFVDGGDQGLFLCYTVGSQWFCGNSLLWWLCLAVARTLA
jgi:hypothetical protein